MTSKKIKFHFVSTQAKNDVWLEKKSNRIAPLHTHTTKPKPRPRPPKKPQQSDGEKDSKFEASKFIKREAGDENIVEAESTKFQSGQQSIKLRIEDEEESDGMSFADMDDSDSDDDMESDGFDHNGRVVASKDKEQVDESPTVTDHSSSDGSHKRDFEASPAEHSDLENDNEKATDQPNTGFIIPKKKKESSKKSAMVVPKNVIPKKQSSVPSGKSLISNAARQAMLDKKMEKKTAKHPRRPQSLSSPSKDSRHDVRKRMHPDEYTSPPKRKAFSDLSPSQSRHKRGSISNGPQANESPTNEGKYRRPMISPMRSFKDKYSIEQRRERELYRDSTEYTAKGQNLSYPDPSVIVDRAGRDFYPKHSLSDRYSERHEREFYRDSNEYSAKGDIYSYHDYSGSRDHPLRRYNDRRDMPQSPPSDQRRGADTPSNRNYDYHHHQDQYDSERGRSQYYERPYDQNSHARYQENSMGYRDTGYDQRNGGYPKDRRTNTTGSYNESLRFDEYARRGEEGSLAYASRSQENYNSPRARGNNEREMERDNNYHRVNDYEQAYPTHSNHNDYYHDDDRHSPRRHRGSGSRKEKKRRRKFDGSDEYSRRLESYNYSQGRTFSNEDMGRDRYGR